MGSSALNIIIEDKFKTVWGATTPIRFDNVPFQIPQSSWVSIEVWDGDSSKASLGTSPQLRRTFGTVFVGVFTPVAPEGIGSGGARSYADSVKAIFRDLSVSGVTFFEASVSRLGEKYYTNSGTGVPATSQWYQMSVAIPFKYDEYL